MEETVLILEGIRHLYEDHHHLKITDEALKAAAHLAARYVTERFMPEKAIDLVDEASRRVRLYRVVQPSGLRDAMQELEAISKEKESLVASEDYEKAVDLREREAQLRQRISRLEEGCQAEKST